MNFEGDLKYYVWTLTKKVMNPEPKRVNCLSVLLAMDT